MDTETVLKIIEMLIVKITALNAHMYEHDKAKYKQDEDYFLTLAERNVLEDFRNHLQEYIESQVNQVENEMNRGE
jgi:hypothetical protein